MNIRLMMLIGGMALVAALPAAPAKAASQVLGIVAGAEPVPLLCDDFDCRTELSAFCLQQARPMPSRGTSYRPVGEDDVTLLVTTTEGEVRRLAGSDYLAFASSRGFTSVRVSLPRATLERLDATAVAIEVGPGASLLPVAEADDANPQTAEEIALASGPMRATADRFFAAGGTEADAARFTNLLLNALPERGRSGADHGADLWNTTVGATGHEPTGANPAGLALAHRRYQDCQQDVADGFHFSMRRCLEAAHDRLMLGVNVRFWEAVGGS
jgi:hypothetical protein